LNFKSSERNDINREIEWIFMSTCRKQDTSEKRPVVTNTYLIQKSHNFID